MDGQHNTIQDKDIFQPQEHVTVKSILQIQNMKTGEKGILILPMTPS